MHEPTPGSHRNLYLNIWSMIFGQGVTAEKLYKLDKRFVILTPGSRAKRSSPRDKITHCLSSTYILLSSEDICLNNENAPVPNAAKIY